MQVDLFEKIKKGIVKRTNDFQVESIRRGTDDSYKYNTYLAILDMISEGYVEGNKDIQGYLGPNYNNLKVTKSGLEVYKFWKTPINQIGKPTRTEVLKNAIIGIFVGRLAWWFVATCIIILIPTFNENTRNLLKQIISWLLT